MVDGGSGTIGLWCPACLNPVGDRARCPVCDLPQDGSAPARLRVVVARLHEVNVEQSELQAERVALGYEREGLLASLRDGPEPTPLATVAQPPEALPGLADWRPERVRDVLVWLGAALLALSAITFAIVAWAHLDDTGRAGMLLGATAVAGGAAVGLRRRLRATAEALTGLTLALGLIDWYVVRRAGVGSGVDTATWWAIGTALIGSVALAGALVLELRSARLAGALLGLVAGAFTIAATTDATWTAAVVSALVASVAVLGATAADRWRGWRDVTVVLLIGAGAFEVATLVLAATSIKRFDTTADAFGPAVAILAIGLAPAVAVAFAGVRRRAPGVGDLLVGVTAAALISATVALLSADLGTTGLAVLGAALGVVAVGLGRRAPRMLRLGVAGAGTGALVVALLAVSSRIVLAVGGPLAWLSDPWSGPLHAPAEQHFGPSVRLAFSGGWATVVVLLAVVVAAAIASGRPGWRAPLIPAMPAQVVVSAALPAALAVALPASGASIGTTLVVELVAAVGLTGLAVALEANRPALEPWLLGAAAVLLVPVAGWSAVDRGATIAVLGVVLAAAGLAGIRTRAITPRVTLIMVATGAALTEAGVVLGSATDNVGFAGVAVAAVGGAVLVLGALGRRSAPEGPALEIVGVLGLGFGAVLGTASGETFATVLTVSAAALGTASLRRDRVGYARSTVILAVGAIWAWLAVADVSVLEAYTVPAAAVMLGAGVLRRRSHPNVGSWAAYGPGLALALGPSLLVALERGGTARPLGVIAGSVACVLVGSRRRLRAPLTIGAVALLALAVDDLGPVAARVPRWVMLGTIGLVLLWLGASAERRLNQVRQWRDSLRQLG